ncbi:MAG: hypothetical protein SPI77_08810 [Corynebacterium sp.]|nr:hypothetical protein [Corynebacterium sp.]
MRRLVATTLTLATLTSCIVGGVGTAASAQNLADLDNLTEAQKQKVLDSFLPEGDTTGKQILGALSSDGKEQPVGGQLLDILLQRDPTQVPDSETTNSSTSNIPDGYSKTTDDLKASLTSLEKVGIALAVILGIFLLLDAAANVITIGQALPSFGL